MRSAALGLAALLGLAPPAHSACMIPPGGAPEQVLAYEVAPLRAMGWQDCADGPAAPAMLKPVDAGAGLTLYVPRRFGVRCGIPATQPDAPWQPRCLMGAADNELADGAGLFCPAGGAADIAWISRNYAQMLTIYPQTRGWTDIVLAPGSELYPVAGMPRPTLRSDIHLTARDPAERNSYAVIYTAAIGDCALERHLNAGRPLTPAQVAAVEDDLRAMLAALPGG